MSEAGPTADQGQAEELLLPGLPGSCGYLYADDISGEILHHSILTGLDMGD